METLEHTTKLDKQQSRINHPGYCGKLPQRGDFIRNAVDGYFARTWDEWISAGLDYSKQVLGDQWLQRYLHAPVWRFYLASGVIGEHAHIGLWFPSMDKVGRYFPFTFCCPIHEAQSGWITDSEVENFLARLERIGMVALDEACEIEDVDEALAETCWPLQEAATHRGNKGKLCEESSSIEALKGLNTLLFDIVRNDHPKLSFWWTRRGNGETVHKIHDGMPDEDRFIDFI